MICQLFQFSQKILPIYVQLTVAPNDYLSNCLCPHLYILQLFAMQNIQSLHRMTLTLNKIHNRDILYTYQTNSTSFAHIKYSNNFLW